MIGDAQSNSNNKLQSFSVVIYVFNHVKLTHHCHEVDTKEEEG